MAYTPTSLLPTKFFQVVRGNIFCACMSHGWYCLCLQEAGYCCRGTDGCNAVMRLPGPAQDEVWAAVNRGDAIAVRQHMTPLRLTPTQVSPGCT